jgi:hypothetical protein
MATSNNTAATNPRKKLSMFQYYRTWEHKFYSKKFSDPQDIAGIEAYADYFYSWRAWWMHLAQFVAGLGLTMLFMQWFALPWYAAGTIGFIVVLVFCSYLALAWFTPFFYIKNFKLKLISLVPMVLSGLLLGVVIGATTRWLQDKARLPTATEIVDILLRAAQHPLAWLAAGGLVLWAVLLMSLAVELQ